MEEVGRVDRHQVHQVMFIAFVRFPKVSPEQDKEFKEWFEWSNQLLRKTPGLISRKLLLGRDGNYTAIIEHSEYDTFMAMHSSKEHKLVHEKALTLLDNTPKPEFFQVISTLSQK
jgi:antibiotic biosynthesis monooxygenase (ABM) superfamily enzyme